MVDPAIITNITTDILRSVKILLIKVLSFKPKAKAMAKTIDTPKAKKSTYCDIKLTLIGAMSMKVSFRVLFNNVSR